MEKQFSSFPFKSFSYATSAQINNTGTWLIEIKKKIKNLEHQHSMAFIYLILENTVDEGNSDDKNPQLSPAIDTFPPKSAS